MAQDDVLALDGDLSALIAAELQLAAGLQLQLATLQGLLNTANADPQASYTVSGPDGSQTFDWNGYRNSLVNQQNSLLQQLNDSLRRLKELFQLKSVNLPFFRVR